MKMTRRRLVILLIATAAFMLGYTLAHEFLHVSFGKFFDDNIGNGVIIIALGVLFANRKIVSDEKKAREAEEEKKKEAESNPGS